jgi:hypothetical protein
VQMLTCWVEFALGAWEGAAAGGIGHRRVELTRGEMAGPRANSRRVRDDAANAFGGERRRICRSPFAEEANCIPCMGAPLESVFGMKNTVMTHFWVWVTLLELLELVS